MKKFISTLFASLLLVSNAWAFQDVPSEAWYAPFVSDLESEGIIDSGEFFRPADSLNRAELVKMVIEATTGIEDYEAPAFPTFDDVPKEAWFAPYVEEAATRGIVSGYKDSTGSLTGEFGPADIVTRAAAAKILVEGFSLQTDTQEESGFPDVREGDWFHDYVAFAQDYGIVSGYSSGFFGPNDPVTRAQIAKMLSLALDPEDNTEEEEEMEEEMEEEQEEEMEEEEQKEEETGEMAVENPLEVASAVAGAGDTGILVGRYRFKGIHEGFHIDTLTLVNDTTTDTLGDDPVSTTAIKNITLKYPNEDGFLRTAERSLPSDGKARFSNLELFAPDDSEAFLEIYVDLNSFAEVGEGLTGETFRLGIQNINNDTQSFKAVGEHSGNTVTFGQGATFSTGSEIEPFTVRESMPSFSINEGPDNLLEGVNELVEFDVTAASSGSVDLARMVFEVTLDDDDAANLSLSDFKFYEDSDLVEEAVIYDATGGQNLSPAGGGSLTDGLSNVIVSFDEAQTVSAGSSKTFTLKATVSGSGSGDNLITAFADGDENNELSGLTAAGNENTGKVYVNADATAGIFTNATDFSQVVGTERNIIWSDQSGKPHTYPSVAAGSVTSDSGSSDFTNGYLLDVNQLDPVVLSK